MSAIEKPENAEAMLYQLWFAVIGSNGNGLISKVDRIERALPLMMTKEQHDEEAKTETVQRERRRMSPKDWALILATAVPTLLLVYMTFKAGIK